MLVLPASSPVTPFPAAASRQVVPGFTVTRCPEAEHGVFLSGDCYVVWEVGRLPGAGGGRLPVPRLFFWVGAAASMDCATVASFKAAELARALRAHAAPSSCSSSAATFASSLALRTVPTLSSLVSRREAEGEESSAFLDMFKRRGRSAIRRLYSVLFSSPRHQQPRPSVCFGFHRHASSLTSAPLIRCVRVRAHPRTPWSWQLALLHARRRQVISQGSCRDLQATAAAASGGAVGQITSLARRDPPPPAQSLR